MQHDAADQLHIVMAQADEAAAAFAANRKRFDQQIVQCLAGPQPLAESVGLLSQLGVGHRLVLGLQAVDGNHHRLQTTDVAGVGRPEQRRNTALKHFQQAAEKQPDDFPNSFQDFHDLSNLVFKDECGSAAQPAKARNIFRKSSL